MYYFPPEIVSGQSDSGLLAWVLRLVDLFEVFFRHIIAQKWRTRSVK